MAMRGSVNAGDGGALGRRRLLSARENLTGTLVAVQRTDVFLRTPDASRDGRHGRRDHDRTGRNSPPNQDRKHEPAP